MFSCLRYFHSLAKHLFTLMAPTEELFQAMANTDCNTTTELEEHLSSLPKIKFDKMKLKQESFRLNGLMKDDKIKELVHAAEKLESDLIESDALVAAVPFLALFGDSFSYLGKATHIMSTLVNWINDHIDADLINNLTKTADRMIADFFAKDGVNGDRYRIKCKGFSKQFKTSICFLNGFNASEKRSEDDIKALSAHVLICQGVKFIGILEDKLDQMMDTYDSTKDSKDVKEAKKILKYMDIYLRLTLVRRIVLLKMYYIIEESGYCPALANGVLNVVRENDYPQNASPFRNPSSKDVLILAVLSPDDNQFLHEYMTAWNMYQDLKGIMFSSVKMRTVKWTDWYIFPSQSYIKGMNCSPDEGNFHFEKACTGNYFFWKTEENKYVRKMDENSWLTYADDKPKDEGMFKIIKLNDGTYKISPLKWPTKFVTMHWFHAYLYLDSGCQDDSGKWEICGKPFIPAARL